MAATPESKVKKKIVDLLKRYDAYFFYPVTGGYGRSGVPDIVCCWRSRFIGIECKANGNQPTDLQMKNLVDIANQGGLAVIIDETGIGMLMLTMEAWNTHGIPIQGQVIDWTDCEEPPI
jgi:hypothetical protein